MILCIKCANPPPTFDLFFLFEQDIDIALKPWRSGYPLLKLLL